MFFCWKLTQGSNQSNKKGKKKVRISTCSNCIHFSFLFIRVSCNCNRELHRKGLCLQKKCSAVASRPETAQPGRAEHDWLNSQPATHKALMKLFSATGFPSMYFELCFPIFQLNSKSIQIFSFSCFNFFSYNRQLTKDITCWQKVETIKIHSRNKHFFEQLNQEFDGFSFPTVKPHWMSF